MRFGITFQREYSVLEGKPRENPIQPIHREPAVVTIGQKHLMARIEVAPQNHTAFVHAWAERNNHWCPAIEMGEFCGHKV